MMTKILNANNPMAICTELVAARETWPDPLVSRGQFYRVSIVGTPTATADFLVLSRLFSGGFLLDGRTGGPLPSSHCLLSRC
uniref:Uncharacterized protein n=1 Tax=Utricularia reniformis TaxID=192314 RepID=A0A1Y0B1A8_9LAMI|nr:hypothetical protein AEK19_MT0911 [Utricularia reniformis]ART31139.1 hypothetical protein AEK19_MT0911 [Utricularia reniformis]